MKRAMLWTLHALGWMAFVPLVTWSAVTLVIALVLLVRDQFAVVGFASSAAMLALSLPGLATIIATRNALRRLKVRELTAPGFEPVMGRKE
jgi:hypothetical protein